METMKSMLIAASGMRAQAERMRAAGCVVLVISTEEQLDEWLPPL